MHPYKPECSHLQECEDENSKLRKEISKRKGEESGILGLCSEDLNILEKETKESWERVRKLREDKRICTICFKNRKNRIIKPCCHLICDVCLESWNTVCPWCRGGIEGDARLD